MLHSRQYLNHTLIYRENENDEIQFDAASFMDTVGNLLGRFCFVFHFTRISCKEWLWLLDLTSISKASEPDYLGGWNGLLLDIC